MDRSRAKRVLVLQGGGALGAYQAGVYEVLEKCGFQPDWLAGTSIGAVNAALIAGNAPGERVKALRSFWELVSAPIPFGATFANTQLRAWMNEANAAWIAATGVPGFFVPRLPLPFAIPPGAPGASSFYDTAPLRETLETLVDFDRINARETRLSLGAVDVETGQQRYFCNEAEPIAPEHVMASGALPPGFPPVKIGDAHYWDGGVVSNTPVEHVLEQNRRGDLLIFQVDLFNPEGPLPRTVLDAVEREKDIRYSSRRRHNTRAALEMHTARMALRGLLTELPESLRNDERVKLLSELAEDHSIKIVQLIYRRKDYEGSAKDFEFSRTTMTEHWAAGMTDAERILKDRQQIETRPSGHMEVIDATQARPPHDT